MTSKINIPTTAVKVPDFYGHGNLVGVISVYSGRRKLRSRRFYSSTARKMIMDDWRKEFKDYEIYFLITLDKIPEKKLSHVK